MKKIVQYTTFSFLLFVSSLQIMAQTYPVQIIPQVASPSPVYLSDYASTNYSTDRVSAQVLLTDLTVMHREIRLKLYIQGNGIQAQSRDFIVGAQSLFLEGGIPLQLGSVDLAPYFELQNLQGISAGVYANEIPEGLYQICLEAYDVLSGNTVSALSCANVLIFLNDPPFLNFPENNINVEAVFPPNILFQWSPRHINVSNVAYEFSLVEIWDNYMDPQAVFLASPPIYQTTTRATSILYGIAEPQLMEGKRYAWRVKAQALDGIDQIGLFKNNGYSEIFSFTFQGDCTAPSFLTVEEVGTKTATFRWQGDVENVQYKIDYRKAMDEQGNTGELNSNHWFGNTTGREEYMLIDLEPDTMYEWRVGGFCTDGTLSYAESVTFTTMAEEAEAYYNCGIAPDIDISNRVLLTDLQKGDVITAGDFHVKITEVTGNGTFSGKGYTTIGFLKNLKIALEFEDIEVNTDYQLINGAVVTVYDPDWNNIMYLDEIVDEFEDVVDAAEELENILDQVFGEEDNEEEESSSDTSSGGMGSSMSSDEGNTSEEDSSAGSDTNSSEENNDSSESESTDENGNNNTATNSDSDTSDGDATADDENVVIVFDGKEYQHGDVIEVPFKDSETNFAFLLKNYPEASKFNWKILYGGTDNTSAFAVNETIHDNLGIDMKSKMFLDIVAHYNDKKIQVTIQRKTKEFDLIDLYAKPAGNRKRLAKTGETLYLIDSPDRRKIDYGVHITPNVGQHEISSQNIIWYYEKLNEQTGLGKHFGKKNIQRNLSKSDDVAVTTVEAGNFFLIDKSIDVVWFAENKQEYNFLPPEVSTMIKNSFDDFDDNLKLIEKYIPIVGDGFKVKPIEIIGSKYNEEHNTSRLYKRVEVGSVKGGISANLDKLKFTHPVLKGLSKLGVVDIGLYTRFSISIDASGGVERYKFIEQKNYQNNQPFMKIVPSGCFIVGIEANLLVAKDLVNFIIDGNVKTCIEGQIKYLFKETRLTGKIYLPPIVLDAKVEIGTKGVLKFELINWEDSIGITDEIPIGEMEYQF